VRAHNRDSVADAEFTVLDFTVAGTNEHVSVENIDRPDEIAEVDRPWAPPDHLDMDWEAISRAIPLDDAAVFATGVELTSIELESADHSLGVALKASNA